MTIYSLQVDYVYKTTTGARDVDASQASGTVFFFFFIINYNVQIIWY